MDNKNICEKENRASREVVFEKGTILTERKRQQWRCKNSNFKRQFDKIAYNQISDNVGSSVDPRPSLFIIHL
jgi:hypothetical protein